MKIYILATICQYYDSIITTLSIKQTIISALSSQLS